MLISRTFAQRPWGSACCNSRVVEQLLVDDSWPIALCIKSQLVVVGARREREVLPVCARAPCILPLHEPLVRGDGAFRSPGIALPAFDGLRAGVGCIRACQPVGQEEPTALLGRAQLTALLRPRRRRAREEHAHPAVGREHQTTFGRLHPTTSAARAVVRGGTGGAGARSEVVALPRAVDVRADVALHNPRSLVRHGGRAAVGREGLGEGRLRAPRVSVCGRKGRRGARARAPHAP